MTQIGSGKPQRDDETYQVIGAAMQVHRTLGPGFLEPVYRAALEIEFNSYGIPWASEVDLSIAYRGVQLRVRYRPDFVCYGSIVVKVKALSRLATQEHAPTINYLKAARMSRGLLLKFGASSLEYQRFINSSA